MAAARETPEEMAARAYREARQHATEATADKFLGLALRETRSTEAHQEIDAAQCTLRQDGSARASVHALAAVSRAKGVVEPETVDYMLGCERVVRDVIVVRCCMGPQGDRDDFLKAAEELFGEQWSHGLQWTVDLRAQLLGAHAKIFETAPRKPPRRVVRR